MSNHDHDNSLELVKPASIVLSLMLGTLTLGSGIAYAFINDGLEADERIYINAQGPAVCETESGETCGDGTLRSKVRLIVQEADDDGTAFGVGSYRGIFEALPTTFKSLGNDGLDFVCLAPNCLVSGPVIANDGTVWNLEMSIEDIDFDNNTASGGITLTSPKGITLGQQGEYELLGHELTH